MKGKLVGEYAKQASREDVLQFALKLLGIDGGPGSGNFGHKGRPGMVGGSGKGGGIQYRGGRSDIGYFGSRHDWLNGLTGERQQAAAKNVQKIKKKYDLAKGAKDVIDGWKKDGKLTEEEYVKKIKESGLENFNDHYSMEAYCVKECKEDLRKDLLNDMKEARSWDKKKDKLMDENLSEDEKKILEFMEDPDKYGKTKDSVIAKVNDYERIKDILTAKALGVDVSTAIPEDLYYDSGIKERPASNPSGNAMRLEGGQMLSFMKKKPTEKFINHVNSVEGRDPEIAEIYSYLSSMEAAGIKDSVNKKVTYTDNEHRFEVASYTFTGKVADVTLRIPKMQVAENEQYEAGTTAHEIGHAIDFLLRNGDTDKAGLYSSEFLEKFRTLRDNFTATSDEVKKLFEDTENEINEGDKAIREKYTAYQKDLNGRISEALKNRNYEEYEELTKKRDKSYNEEQKALRDNHYRTAKGVACLEDIYQALGDIQRRFHHDYRSNTTRLAECWANWCELSLVYPEERKILEREKPEFCALMKEMATEMLGRVRSGSGN